VDAAATDGDDDVDGPLRPGGEPGLHLVGRRVRRDVGEDMDGQPRAPQRVDDPLHEAGGEEAAVG